MISFWIIIAILLLIALCFIATPLLSTLKKKNISRQAINIALHQEKLQQLENDLHVGSIDNGQYQENKTALDKALLQDTNDSHQQANVYRHNKKTLCALAILFPLAVILLYFHWGDSPRVAAYENQIQQTVLAKKDLKRMGPISAVAKRFQTYLNAHPKQAKGWYLLGKLYAHQDQLPSAVMALRKAYRLKPNNPAYAFEYLEMSYFFNHRKFTNETRGILHKLLQTQPRNPVLLNFLAMQKYQDKHYAKAIRIWESLLQYFPPSSKNGTALLKIIAKAQKDLQQHGGSQTDINGPQLQIHVSLANDLKAKTNKDTVVFIYAKALKGPVVPLAIIRKQVSNLPLDVILNDRNAMLPTATLSDYKQVRIFARVSKSGQAIPRTGDFIGQSKVINPRQEKHTVNIIINKPVKF